MGFWDYDVSHSKAHFGHYLREVIIYYILMYVNAGDCNWSHSTANNIIGCRWIVDNVTNCKSNQSVEIGLNCRRCWHISKNIETQWPHSVCKAFSDEDCYVISSLYSKENKWVEPKYRIVLRRFNESQNKGYLYVASRVGRKEIVIELRRNYSS